MNKLYRFKFKLLILLTLIIYLGANVLSPNVLGALTPEQRRIYDSGIYYYDAEVNDFVCRNDAVNLIGNDNVEKAYSFFIMKGLTIQQSAGIVGNLVVESQVNPTAFNPAGGGQGAYGIAQWRAGRQSALKQKDNFDTLDVQLNYLWEELQGSERAAYEAIIQETTVRGAAIAFEEKFERSGGQLMNKRIEAAEEVFTNYENVGQLTNTATASQSNCGGGNGENTRYIDGFTVYSQYDPTWKDLPYSTSTIGESGCGPAAMAMIITNLTGKQVTPVETANYAAGIGMYIDNQGSSWNISPRLAENWGLKYDQLTKNVAAITAALREGKLVITSGSGPKPFTSGGHFIVIRGVTADGKFKIGDSGHTDTNNQEYDPEFLLTYMNAGNIYAIYN